MCPIFNCSWSGMAHSIYVRNDATFKGTGLVILIFIISAKCWLAHADSTNYHVQGVIKEIRSDQQQLVIAHDVIPGFMEAMTMPFRVRDAKMFGKVSVGAPIRFELHVTASESWIDDIKPITTSQLALPRDPIASKNNAVSDSQPNSAKANPSKDALRTYKFTNELGQAVSLADFRGRALALTFFFTRCPIPEFCPRLSKNFQEAQRKMRAMKNAPENWHLLSITFDPERDTPENLKAYGESYQYDSEHWSFLTGPKDKIRELARSCDVTFEPDSGFFNHNFRTLIIDASNRLQMVFPTSGDISDSIVKELIKAAAAK